MINFAKLRGSLSVLTEIIYSSLSPVVVGLSSKHVGLGNHQAYEKDYGLEIGCGLE
jgi:hypothetical protein